MLGLLIYAVITFVSTLFIMRVRPEWLLMRSPPDLMDKEWYPYADRRDVMEYLTNWSRWESLYRDEIKAMIARAEKAKKNSTTPLAAPKYVGIKTDHVGMPYGVFFCLVSPLMVLALPLSIVMTVGLKIANSGGQPRKETIDELKNAYKELDDFINDTPIK